MYRKIMARKKRTKRDDGTEAIEELILGSVDKKPAKKKSVRKKSTKRNSVEKILDELI
jgi:hypothetical protein